MSTFLNSYSGLLYSYAGILWLPVGLLVVHPPHRWLTAAFVVTCILTLRIQVELMDSIGYPAGFLPILSVSADTRGLAIYSVVIALFLLLARFSPKTPRTVFFAAALSVYILTFCLSMVVMMI